MGNSSEIDWRVQPKMIYNPCPYQKNFYMWMIFPLLKYELYYGLYLYVYETSQFCNHAEGHKKVAK